MHLPGEQIKSKEAARASIEDILKRLDVNVRYGLSQIEAERRLKVHGFNEFQSEEEHPLWRKYLEQFLEPMILLLLGSAVVSAFMGQYDDALSITVAILIVVTVAFIQGYRSDKALEALKELMPPRCQCLRDGTTQNQYARDLVPGDVVYLQTGDRVPADLRLFESVDLSLDESSLTGEAEPARKVSSSLSEIRNKEELYHEVDKKRLRLHSQSGSQEVIYGNLVYLGTLVRCGSGKGIVTSTGSQTEFGEVFRMMQAEEAPRTPLQKSMDDLGKQLTIYSFFIIGGIVLIGLFQQRKLLEMFTIAVSLAVAAIPEGLPIVVTVTLAIGQMRMAKRNAIVKKLPAVETLGCVNVVCSDKTGTLTQNEMTVTRIITCDGIRANVSGVGYSADGQIWTEDNQFCITAESHPSVKKIAEIACICNNAYIVNGELHGQPTEGALLCFAAKMRMSDLRQEFTRLQEIPFSSETKIMKVKCTPNRSQISSSFHSLSSSSSSSQLQQQQQQEIFFVKGATDRVIKDSSYVWMNGRVQSLTEEEETRLLQEASIMGRQGLRVIAVARSLENSPQQLVFHGLLGIMDPPRPGVDNAITDLQNGGVRIVMITGDAKETACAIGRHLGIYRSDDLCWSGDDVENMTVEQMAKNIHTCSVFYRTTPRHKCKIVKAFQQRGFVVAMTGDGVNDAVALKSADIGLAMGRTGTDVCKEAADIVLVDDDFSTILAAMEEGKGIFYNIRNFIRFQLSTSIAALSLISLSTLFSLPNPLNPMQILWINILMDGPPAQSLGVEPVDHDVIRQPPRNRKEPILSVKLLVNIILSAIIIVAGTMWIFYREMHADNLVTPRDTTMTFTCFVLFDMFNALACRSQTKSLFTLGFTRNRFFLVAVGLSLLGQLMVIYFPPLQSIFQTEALYPSDLLLLVSLTSSIFWFSEVKKYFDRHGLSIDPVLSWWNKSRTSRTRKARMMKTSHSDSYV